MFSESPPVITIDGPSGSGKGTVAMHVATSLGWHYLDSGVLYRILALSILEKSLVPEIRDLEEEKLEKLANKLNVSFKPLENDNWAVFLNDLPVSDQIRTEICGNFASKLAVLPRVRQALLIRQRAFCLPPGLVTDGRDMGTVVFPEAKLKIFLQASPEERAKRRYLQLKNKGLDVNLQHILVDINARDVRDTQRTIGALKPAKDAILIDTTGMDIQTVFNKVMGYVKTTFEGI